MSQYPIPSPAGEFEKDFKSDTEQVEDVPKLGHQAMTAAKVKAVRDVCGASR
jgi:hypothetical protein